MVVVHLVVVSAVHVTIVTRTTTATHQVGVQLAVVLDEVALLLGEPTVRDDLLLLVAGPLLMVVVGGGNGPFTGCRVSSTGRGRGRFSLVISLGLHVCVCLCERMRCASMCACDYASDSVWIEFW